MLELAGGVRSLSQDAGRLDTKAAHPLCSSLVVNVCCLSRLAEGSFRSKALAGNDQLFGFGVFWPCRSSHSNPRLAVTNAVRLASLLQTTSRRNFLFPFTRSKVPGQRFRDQAYGFACPDTSRSWFQGVRIPYTDTPSTLDP